jgi:hypothetical protein
VSAPQRPRRTTSTSDHRLRTAVHEAAHSVVAQAVGMTVLGVNVIGDGHLLGYVDADVARHSGRDRSLYLISGLVAETSRFGDMRRALRGAHSDTALVRHFGHHPLEGALWADVKSILRAHEIVFDHVVGELLRFGELSDWDIERTQAVIDQPATDRRT